MDLPLQHVEALEILLQGLCGVHKERLRIHEICLKNSPNLGKYLNLLKFHLHRKMMLKNYRAWVKLGWRWNLHGLNIDSSKIVFWCYICCYMQLPTQITGSLFSANSLFMYFTVPLLLMKKNKTITVYSLMHSFFLFDSHLNFSLTSFPDFFVS